MAISNFMFLTSELYYLTQLCVLLPTSIEIKLSFLPFGNHTVNTMGDQQGKDIRYKLVSTYTDQLQILNNYSPYSFHRCIPKKSSLEEKLGPLPGSSTLIFFSFLSLLFFFLVSLLKIIFYQSKLLPPVTSSEVAFPAGNDR